MCLETCKNGVIDWIYQFDRNRDHPWIFRATGIKGWLKVTWSKRDLSSPSLPSLITHHVFSLFVKRRPGKMWAIGQLIRTQQISKIVTASCKTMIVGAVHQGGVSSHKVRLSELHGTPQGTQIDLPIRNNGRTVLRMPVIHWTNCAFLPLLSMDHVCDTLSDGCAIRPFLFCACALISAMDNMKIFRSR